MNVEVEMVRKHEAKNYPYTRVSERLIYNIYINITYVGLNVVTIPLAASGLLGADVFQLMMKTKQICVLPKECICMSIIIFRSGNNYSPPQY
jgi:cation transport ATPase